MSLLKRDLYFLPFSYELPCILRSQRRCHSQFLDPTKIQ
ncbi:unnamed protein product [Amoebophrya sp. A25]|nr:unnamed protein product [Amoebophrya sp. A25]|eukprot:GSA25T00027502001.1